MSNLIPAQVRAGRALVGWSRAELAVAAERPEADVAALEAGAGAVDPAAAAAVEQALVRAGVRFLADGEGGGAGVRLFREPLEGWLQCVQPAAAPDLSIHQRFATLWMLQRASDMALFSRPAPDGSGEVFLISEAAARMAAMLPGEWTPAETPSLHAWTLRVGAGDPHQRFGLAPAAAAPPSP